MKLRKAVSNFLGTKLKLSSYPTYRSAAKYIQFNYDLAEIDLAGDLKVSERRNRINKTRRLFVKIEDKLQGKSQNTKYFTLNLLKAILSHVMDTDGSLFWRKFPVVKEAKDVVILDIDFAKDFINDTHGVYRDLIDNKLKSVHELSSVMLTSCLRFSDARAIEKKHLKDGRVTIKNKKTGVVTSSPLPNGLYQKLLNNLKDHGHVYSVEMTKDDYYRLYPTLFKNYPEMCKMTDNTFLYNTTKYHVFRKTAISIMLVNNVPQAVIMRASGHSIGSKSFAKYVGFVETMHNEEITNFQTKFYGNE